MNAPGTRNEDFYAWENNSTSNIIKTNCVGPFEILMTIQHNIRKNPYALDLICTLPDHHESSLWQYEHLRQFVLELNSLLACLEGACTKTSCPIMKATDDWIFLCAAHASPKECCAWEYMVHTMDGINK